MNPEDLSKIKFNLKKSKKCPAEAGPCLSVAEAL